MREITVMVDYRQIYQSLRIPPHDFKPGTQKAENDQPHRPQSFIRRTGAHYDIRLDGITSAS
ncbi:hypothetical protein [Streptomyces sp. NRRL F-525]|uniref:hypothetical protein n=1 Tax=Streptomyces sp. NRRL F-525 TaxID=1463861 RepID=UPI0005249A28|nr:hypothetical protein [Streptomyces sp. NRRL F-525]